jgi:serine protease
MTKHYNLGFTLFLFAHTLSANSNTISIEKPTTNQELLSLVHKSPTTSNDGFIPNDPLFDKQWGLKNTLGFDVGATSAWAITRGDKKVAIAIIDTGIDYSHPDLVNNMWVNPNEIPDNGIDDDHNGYIDDVHGINAITGTGDPMDDHGHGTHVAGVIGAQGNNGIGISGLMPNVSLIACKFLDRNGGGTTEGILRCMNYIADLAKQNNGVTIVATNNAWGGGGYSEDVLKAIERHRDLNILFVTTSGGSALDLDKTEQYPARYNVSNMIVTAKMDPLGNLASFSSFGPNTVHLAAPGAEILSTTLNGAYEAWSGSSATGFVTGIAGLLKAANMNLTAEQIKQKIMAGVVKLSTPEDEMKLISGGYCNAFNSLAAAN